MLADLRLLKLKYSFGSPSTLSLVDLLGERFIHLLGCCLCTECNKQFHMMRPFCVTT